MSKLASFLLVLAQAGLCLCGYDCIRNCACQITTDYLLFADCSAENFTRIPEPEFKYRLDILHLEYNQITEIYNGDFDHFDRLEELNLHSNGLEIIQENALTGLSRLRRLDLSNNKLIAFPWSSSLNLAFTLTWISLAKNNFGDFPAEVSSYTHLELFDISDNKLNSTEFKPDSLAKGLKRLKLQRTGLHVKSLEGLNSLKYVDLSFCVCKDLNQIAFSNMINLTTLLLSNTQLTSPPLLALRVGGGALTAPVVHEIVTVEGSGDLTEVPTVFPGVTTWHNPVLSILDLSNNPDLTIGPDDIIFPPFLVDVNLANTILTRIDKHFFGDALTVEYVDLSYSNLTSISSDAFQSFFNLTELSLSGNPIDSFPIFPGTLVKISLSETGVTTLASDTFLFSTAVMQANISHGNINSLQNHTFGSMMALEQLDLSGNKFTKLERNSLSIGAPGMIHLIPSLRDLDLSEGQLSDIQAGSFSTHVQLRSLDLSNNKIKSLVSGTFQGQGNLKILKISENKIVDLEPGIFEELVNLKILHAESNVLEVIHAHTLDDLNKLEELHLANNNLMTIHGTSLSSLHLLDVSKNSLSSYPEVMGENLEILDASQNPILVIDASHNKNLVKLQHLNLSHCQLNSIHYEAVFMHTTSLETLDLSYNNIPNFFDTLSTSLKHLYFANNDIHAMNQTLRDVFPNINTLDVRNNSISYVDPAIFKDLKALKRINFSDMRDVKCNCDLIDFVEWIQSEETIVVEADSYNCTTPPEKKDTPVISAVKSLQCETDVKAAASSKLAMYIAIGIAVAFFIIILILAARFLCKRNPTPVNDHILNADGTITPLTQASTACMCCKRCGMQQMYSRRRGRFLSEESRDLVEIMTSPVDKDAPVSI